MKIVFLGTPDFAVATLRVIYEAGHEIVAVVTVPDKPQGRGLKYTFSPVKEFALKHRLPILQPENLKDVSFIRELTAFQASLFVVVAFRMLPEEVFLIPPKGTFNAHASLLPDYRGAAPIHRAIMNGEKITGVTTFFLNKEMDKGDIIAQEEVEILDDETTGELYEKLKKVAATLVVKTINLIETDSYTLTSQQNLTVSEIKKAPKIQKEDTLINWNRPAEVIFNQIRGLSPSPGAYTRIRNIEGEIFTIKCFKASILNEKSEGKPGTISIYDTNKMTVATQNFQISLQNIQFQSKKRMEISDFLLGFKSEKYTSFLF